MKARCILVLGMHRSGTSALTRVLNLLGADLSRSLIASKPSNVTGFWESQHVLDINNVLLKQFGLLWRDDLPLPDDWLEHPAAAEAEGLILDYLKVEFSDRPLFAIKDPRLCRVLPLWIRAVETFGAEPLCVLVYRHPVQVAASLEKRDGLPMEPSLHLWMRSYLEAESASRGRPRLILAYDRLLDDWRGAVARIAAAFQTEWPTPPSEIASAVEEFLSPSHRHHSATEFDAVADADLREAVRAMYAGIEALAAGSRLDWPGIEREANRLLDARCERYGPILRLERIAYFEERDDKRRLKHYAQRLEDKLKQGKKRHLRLKRKWKLIVAVVVPLAVILGWTLRWLASAP